MKFFELAVGDRFLYNGIIHEKVKEERISCCKVGKNAIVYGDTASKVVLKPLEDVEKYPPSSPPTTGHTAPAKAE
jgi:hypothetical protein